IRIAVRGFFCPIRLDGVGGWVGGWVVLGSSVVVFLTTTTLGWVVPTHPPTHSPVGGWVNSPEKSRLSADFCSPTHSPVGGWVVPTCGWVVPTCGWVGGSPLFGATLSTCASTSSFSGRFKPRTAKGENRRVRRSKTASSS